MGLDGVAGRACVGAWLTRVMLLAYLAAMLPASGAAAADEQVAAAALDENDDDNDETRKAAATPTMFPRGTWTLELGGAYYHSIVDDEDITSGVGGFGYYFDRKHAFRIELVGHHLHEEGPGPDEDDATALGGNLGLRYHYFEHERLSLFIDGSLGFFYGNRNWPEGGTHFNFNEQLGLGATFRLDEHAHLIGGVRYIHVSNARIRGEDENPSFDGLGGFVGLLFSY